jgi:hypothetical protein
MRAMDSKIARKTKALGAIAGASALLFTVGCGTRDTGVVAAQQLAANAAGTPVVVSCEPNQRSVVRPVVMNGTTVSQVECVSVAQQAPVAQAQAAPVVTYAPAARTVAARPVYSEIGDAQIVPISSVPARTTAARPVRTSQVVYEEPVKKGRSVKKSAIIIGSSAGAGAGVGAIVGGKKGALIGAAIGGGGAAVWDQITRRK